MKGSILLPPIKIRCNGWRRIGKGNGTPQFVTESILRPASSNNFVQGVLNFGDIWFQKVLINCGDHEF